MFYGADALKKVLEDHKISAHTLFLNTGISEQLIKEWIAQKKDLTADEVTDVTAGLVAIDPSASEEFIALFLKRRLRSDDVGG